MHFGARVTARDKYERLPLHYARKVPLSLSFFSFSYFLPSHTSIPHLLIFLISSHQLYIIKALVTDESDRSSSWERKEGGENQSLRESEREREEREQEGEGERASFSEESGGRKIRALDTRDVFGKTLLHLILDEVYSSFSFLLGFSLPPFHFLILLFCRINPLFHRLF